MALKQARRTMRTVKVDNITRQERECIQRALADDEIRGLTITFGVLQPLDPPARRRALLWAAEALKGKRQLAVDDGQPRE